MGTFKGKLRAMDASKRHCERKYCQKFVKKHIFYCNFSLDGEKFPSTGTGLQASLRLQADTERLQTECAALTQADRDRLKQHSGRNCPIFQCFFNLFTVQIAVHPEPSGFRGVWLPVDVHGIHQAAGPDFMHLMLEGIANTLLDCVVKFLHDRRK
jgi:hypothetical protein